MINKKILSLVNGTFRYILLTALMNFLSLLTGLGITAGIVYGFYSLNTYGFTDTLLLITTGSVVLIALRMLFIRLGGKFSAMIAGKVKRELRKKLYTKLINVGQKKREKYGIASMTQMAIEGIEQLELYFSVFLPQLVYGLLAPITVFAVLSFINIKMAVLLLICIPLIPLLIVAANKSASKKLGKYWDDYASVGDMFLDKIQGLTTLKAYNADKDVHDKLNKQAEKFRKSTMNVLKMQLNSITIMDLIAYGGAAAAALIGILDVSSSAMGVFLGLFAVLVSAEFFLPLRALGSAFHIASNGIAALKKMTALLELPEQHTGKEELVKILDISFKNLSFSYNKDKDALTGINLNIKNKGLTAITGESGSGKSTVCKLLTGEYNGYSGNLQINGRELWEYSQKSIYKRIGVINAESYIFSGTIRENLLMAAPDATESQIYASLKKVNLYEIVMGRPQKLDARIEEGGSNLSGGEKQRLSLAAVMLKDCDLYIFDEATSNIDSNSEEIILKEMTELSKTKSVVLITHRLNNTVAADNLIVLSKGRLAEQGTSGNLLKDKGMYYRLFSAQRELEKDYGKEEKTIA